MSCRRTTALERLRNAIACHIRSFFINSSDLISAISSIPGKVLMAFPRTLAADLSLLSRLLLEDSDLVRGALGKPISNGMPWPRAIQPPGSPESRWGAVSSPRRLEMGPCSGLRTAPYLLSEVASPHGMGDSWDGFQDPGESGCAAGVGPYSTQAASFTKARA